MKRTLPYSLLLVFWGLLILPAAAEQLEGTSWEKAQEEQKGTIVIAYVPGEPFAYKGLDGKVTGFEVDIMKQYISFMKNRYKIVLTPSWVSIASFSEIYNGVKEGNGGVFGLASVSITDARKKEIAFSPPYLTSLSVLLSRNDVPELKGLSQCSIVFDGFTGLTIKGTTHEKNILALKTHYYPDMKIEYRDSSSDIMKEISSSENNCIAYIDLVSFWPEKKKGELAIKRHPVGDKPSEDFGIIMPLDSQWQKSMEDFFTMGTGFRSYTGYFMMLTKYFGKEASTMLKLAVSEKGKGH